MRHAAATLDSGRSEVVGRDERARATGSTAGSAYAIAVPLLVDDRVVGALVAYSAYASANLVRAANEVGRWVSAQLDLAELDASRTRAMEAEVRALRAQISPHFIYNSLSAIASFVRTDPERARDLLLEFADFTRYSFRRYGDFTTLAEELRCDRALPAARARALRRPAAGHAADRARRCCRSWCRSSACSRSSRTPSGTGWPTSPATGHVTIVAKDAGDRGA